METLKLAAAVALASSLVAISAQAGEGNSPNKNATIPTDSCFWTGPFVQETPATDILYLDRGAYYWATEFTIPEGANLEFSGRFPHARYMSFNSYVHDVNGNIGIPYDVAIDSEITPDKHNAKNPYIPGNLRTTPLRGYTINVESGELSASDDSNTVRTGKAGGEFSEMIYRIYLPDTDTGITGGEYLPSPMLTLADGTVIADEEEVCAELSAEVNMLTPPYYPVPVYTQIEAAGHPYVNHLLGSTEASPAFAQKSFNPTQDINCQYFYQCAPNPTQGVGFYANFDNQYNVIFISDAQKTKSDGSNVYDGFKELDSLEVMVVKGKLPTTPKTLDGEKVMTDGQLRYWSACIYEGYSQKLASLEHESCLNDETIVTDAEGYYTIAISKAGKRPSNATPECGVNWLPMSENGTGYGDTVEGKTNNVHESALIVRNMLPSPDFDQALQNVTQYSMAHHAQVMGEYNSSYFQVSKADFEARGCN